MSNAQKKRVHRGRGQRDYGNRGESGGGLQGDGPTGMLRNDGDEDGDQVAVAATI